MKNIIISILLIIGACIAGVANFAFALFGGLYIKELLDQGFWLADYLGHAVVIAFFCSIIWPLFTFLAMKGSFRQMQAYWFGFGMHAEKTLSSISCGKNSLSGT